MVILNSENDSQLKLSVTNNHFLPVNVMQNNFIAVVDFKGKS